MNKKLFSVVLAASLVLPLAAGAQTSTQPAGGNGARAIRQNLGGEVKKLRDATKTAIEAKREDFQREAEAKREQFKKDVESARESAKKQLEQKREAAKKAIEDIKDAKKKDAIKRIDLNLTETNTRMVGRYTENLNQLDKVLTNITTRTDRAQARGLAVNTVRTAITAASTSIASARAAVVAQSGKTYAAIITTSTTTKADIAAVRDALKRDLKTVETAVKSARDAVHAAAVTLAQVPRIGESEPAATSTATSTAR